MTQNQISYFKAKEEQRHNQAMEAEQQRSNRANEAIQKMNAESTKSHYERQDAETARANYVKESQNAVIITQDYTKLAQDERKIQETAKHNRNQEEIDWINANARATEAAAKVVTSRASAEADYARAGLTYAQTAHEDVLARLDMARTDLTNAQRDVAVVTVPNVMADTQVKRSTRDKVITETSYIPLNTWANVIRSLGIGGLIK